VAAFVVPLPVMIPSFPGKESSQTGGEPFLELGNPF